MSGNMFVSLVPYRLLQSDHLGFAGSQFLASFRHVNGKGSNFLARIWPKSTEDYREKLCPEDCFISWSSIGWAMIGPCYALNLANRNTHDDFP